MKYIKKGAKFVKEKEKKEMDNLAYKLKKYTYADWLEMDDDKR